MLKKLSFIIVGSLVLGGCSNPNDLAYSNLLKSTPKWNLEEKTDSSQSFIDISKDGEQKKTDFIRLKTTSLHDGVNSETISIYRLDCENHRAAEYYEEGSDDRKANVEKLDNGDVFEFERKINYKKYNYNPTEPNSINKLWQSFPTTDNVFAKTCKLKPNDVKPVNPKMPDWEFDVEFSKMLGGISYLKKNKDEAAKNDIDVSVKTFEAGASSYSVSTERNFKLNCDSRSVKAINVITRNNDFEYAPNLNQEEFSFKKVFANGVREFPKDDKDNPFKKLCS